MTPRSPADLPQDWPSRAISLTHDPMGIAQMVLVPHARLRVLAPDDLSYGGPFLTAAKLMVPSAIFAQDTVMDQLLKDMLPRARVAALEHHAAIADVDLPNLAALLLGDLSTALGRPAAFDPAPILADLARLAYFTTDGRRQTISACLGHGQADAALSLLAADKREITVEVKSAQIAIAKAVLAGDSATAQAAYAPLLEGFFRLQAVEAMSWADLFWLAIAGQGGPTPAALAALREKVRSLATPGT